MPRVCSMSALHSVYLQHGCTHECPSQYIPAHHQSALTVYTYTLIHALAATAATCPGPGDPARVDIREDIMPSAPIYASVSCTTLYTPHRWPDAHHPALVPSLHPWPVSCCPFCWPPGAVGINMHDRCIITHCIVPQASCQRYNLARVAPLGPFCPQHWRRCSYPGTRVFSVRKSDAMRVLRTSRICLPVEGIRNTTSPYPESLPHPT